MPKLRIHELAKELNKTNKEVMDFLKDSKIDVKSHMSILGDDQEAVVRKRFTSKSAQGVHRTRPAKRQDRNYSNVLKMRIHPRLREMKRKCIPRVHLFRKNR